MIKGILCGSFGCKRFFIQERKVRTMDLVTELIKRGTQRYNEGNLKATIASFAHVVKILRETVKVTEKTTPQTSQKT